MTKSSALETLPHPGAAASSASSPTAKVPRIFQVLVVIYVVVTGELPTALQAILFGLTGGGSSEFTLALLSALLVDIARIAPLFILARHPLGILHPVILAVVLWPLLVRMPATIDALGGLGGLFLGAPATPPYYIGLGWQSAPEIWLATALYNSLEFAALLFTYLGFGLVHSQMTRPKPPEWTLRSQAFRRLLIVLIGASVVALIVLLGMRGGLLQHLADLSRGRFRELAGLGPLITLVDLGAVGMIVWIAARPEDARSLWFLGALPLVAACQFISNGSRSSTLLLFMLLGVTWALRTRRIPWRLAAILAPLIFLSLGYLNLIRTSGMEGQTVVEAIARSDTSSALTRLQEEIADREAISAAVPVVADGLRVTDGPLLGQTYVAAILGFVPRAIWEAKPRGPGSLYSQEFLGDVREGAGIPVGSVAEAYWNFHVIGVILVFFLYGFLLRRVHDFYIVRQDNPFVLSFFVLFVTTFQMHTDSLVAFQQQLLLLFVIYVLARVFASAPSDRRWSTVPVVEVRAAAAAGTPALARRGDH